MPRFRNDAEFTVSLIFTDNVDSVVDVARLDRLEDFMHPLASVDGLFLKAKLGHLESCLCDQDDQYVHGVNAKVNSASLRAFGLDLFKRRRRDCCREAYEYSATVYSYPLTNHIEMAIIARIPTLGLLPYEH